MEHHCCPLLSFLGREHEQIDRHRQQLPELPGAACPDKGNSLDVGDCSKNHQESAKPWGVSDSSLPLW
jgi:hypothetical protein